MERFTGLNIRSFSSMKVFLEILSLCIGHTRATSVHYLPIAKNLQENFCGKLKNRENRESLAQKIFIRLRYTGNIQWYPIYAAAL